jgi:uncharacterized protein
MEIWQVLIIFACLAGGGILKGATGAGAPVLAVPAIAMMFDVRLAVVIMLMPNLLTNIWQAWVFRAHRLPARFLVGFAIAGAVGVVPGTILLASLPMHTLLLIVAGAVFAFVGLRLARPDWQVSYPLAERLSVPMGFSAGVLQGASGVSAPVSISFLNAARLERHVFIPTISIFFAVMTAGQIPALGYLGIVSLQELAISMIALIPLLAGMPVGAALGRRFSKEVFDRVILVVLVALALKLVYDFATA